MARELEGDLARRLPWLLVFRGVVATALLALTLVADLADWPVARLANVLYAVTIGTYVVVVLLGVLLKSGMSPIAISTAHLVTAIAAALMVVQATGGIGSAFSFLYLLAILDGAIIGGRRVALAVASMASVAYGLQLTLQLYGVAAANLAPLPDPLEFINAVVTHLAAFYLMALLAGHLAAQLESARSAASAARASLSHAEAFHGAVLESLPVGVVSVAPDGQILSANSAAARILQISAADLVRGPCPPVLTAFLHGAADSAETAVPLAGQERHLFLSRAAVTLPNAGAESPARPRLALVLEDRTDVKALQQTLRLKERMASIGQMAAGIAHELRNPLAAISGAVELLRGASEVERHKLEAIILREIQRLNALVSDFLVYARPTVPQRSRVDLQALATEVCEVLRTDGAWAAHEISIAATGRVEAEVDPGQLRQTLWNLLRNALEASAPGGAVEVSLTPVSQPTGPAVAITVRDHGSGLSAAAREHLFEPFFTTKASGSGLGLAIVERIVSAHHGSIALDAANGGGTRVEVVLPCTGR
ncbi:MAG: PAS domain-containing protein [Deltaproteobacteria bacterium]|nr:PAS domain-containing protein [Deltaproteobacteria bacterium]